MSLAAIELSLKRSVSLISAVPSVPVLATSVAVIELSRIASAPTAASPMDGSDRSR